MEQMPFKDENERRIGEFLIELNILTSEQVLSILLNDPAFKDKWHESSVSDIVLSQLIDLSN